MKRRFASLLGAIVLVTGAVMIGCNSQSSTPTYTIMLNVSKNGTVEVSPKLPQDGKVPQYTVLTFTAKPNADYETEWAGAAPDAGDKNKAMLTVTANATVSVTFKEKTVDQSLLQIDSYGTLTGVTDKNALAGRLEIPDTVTKIGYNAFEGCTKLTSVTMADNVTEIENNAFKGCSKLTNVTIGSGVTDIKDRAFQNCTSLTSITINSTSLNPIGWGAFENCTELTSLTIGKSVANINFISSYNLPKINAVTVDPDNAIYCSLDNIVYTKDKTKLIFALPSAVSGEFTIPDSVTEIGESAFANCHALSAVTIGARVTKIGAKAFSECHKLTDITIPDSVTEIGDNAFAKCGTLSAVILGNHVTKIGSEAFYECKKLTDITIPDSVTEIGIEAFGSCDRLTSAVFKEPSRWSVEIKGGGTTKNIDQADLEDTSTAARYLKDIYCSYTWKKQ